MSHPAGPVVIDQPRTRAALPFPRLIAALRDAFIAGADVPLRHRHAVAGGDGTLLLMPAWQGSSAMGIKLVTVFPGNGALGLNSVFSTYLLCDGATGQHLAVIDGNEITARRTAAASALAGDFLARRDAKTLLIVGAGHVASMMAQAWSAVRGIEQVTIWNPRPARAEILAATLRAEGYNARATDTLEPAARAADIISCATLATEPLIHGAWLRHGTHLDLIGGYRPDMRETDDTAMKRARVFIDTDAALAEAGDLTQPLAAGTITRADIQGDLAALCRGGTVGRATPGEITLFKSVGSAIEDLAAAALVWAEVK